jgi:hypothetical protein
LPLFEEIWLREKDSVHSGISLQKGAIIVRYGFRWNILIPLRKLRSDIS